MHRLSRSLLLALALSFQAALARVFPTIPNSFYFKYDPPGVIAPIPVTEQCQTINITWGREFATGPSPAAPYYLRVYTSTFLVPFVIPAGSGLSFQWQVPFAPGTQYQICMIDSAGNSGGCQAIYSVIAPYTSTPPTCQNVTFPEPLGISAAVSDGTLSQYGWIPECTDIAVTPTNGTPPYVLTVAPSLRPPYNITIPSMSTLNWTISFGHAIPFFMSVSDSSGKLWSTGPLHSGLGTNLQCLSDAGQSLRKKPSSGTLASAIGSAVGGLVLGGVVTYFFMLFRFKSQRRYSKYAPAPTNSPIQRPIDQPERYGFAPNADPVGPTAAHSLQYHIEPFTMPNAASRTSEEAPAPFNRAPSTSAFTDFTSPQQGPRSESSQNESSSRTRSSRRDSEANQQVIVVHHDGGRVPFSIYSPTGAMVEELPPGYPGVARRNTRATSAGPSDETVELPYDRRQQAPPIPRKGDPSTVYYTN